MKQATFDAERLAPWLVLLAAVAVYLNALGNGFALDDVYIVQQNTRVHNLAAWRNIWLTPYWPFFGSELGLYRPFIIFIYAVQWALGGGAAWVFHLGNIVLHATASLLAFLLLERLTGRVPALVGALLFAVHPLHTEAVANVVGQAELVAAIATFGACLVHVTRPDRIAVSWPRRFALMLLFAIALTTKESAVVLPGLLVALDFAQRRVQLSLRGLADYADALLMPAFLLGATLALYLVLRFEALSGALIGVDAAPALPFLREEHRVLNALRAFPEFIRLLFFPNDLASDYSPGVILPVDSVTLMTLLGLLLLTGFVALSLLVPWWPSIGLPAAWFLISILTVSNLFFPIGVLIAERTLYVPSFALSLLVAITWQHAAAHMSAAARQLAPALVVIVLVLLGVRTWSRNPVWDSTETLMTRLIEEHPESYKAQWVQAAMLSQQKRQQEADLRYEFAYRIYPRDSQFLLEYGRYLMDTGRTERGIALMEQSYRMHPYVPQTITVLAYAYVRAGRYAEALTTIRELERHGAGRPVSMPLRAAAYHGLGEHDRAIAAWRVAVQHTSLNPWIAHGFLARTLAIAGEREQAAAAIASAREIATDSAAQRTLSTLAAAIDDGCYDALAIGDGAGGGVHMFALPACDPLGDYFSFGERQAKSASLLQNANKVANESAVSGAQASSQSIGNK